MTDHGRPESGHERELEQRAKALFDDSVRDLDGATRARLAQARRRALEELEPRGSRFARDWRLAAAGALASLALAIWLVPWQAEPVAVPAMQAAVFDDLELLLDEDLVLDEDLEMFDEELDFYAWLEGQPEFAAAASTGDGIG
jgi:hypothetical protein